MEWDHRARRAAGHVPCPSPRHSLFPVPISGIRGNNCPKLSSSFYLCWTKRNSSLWAGKCNSLPQAGLGSPGRQQQAGNKTSVSNSCCPWGLLLHKSLELKTGSRKKGFLFLFLPPKLRASHKSLPSLSHALRLGSSEEGAPQERLDWERWTKNSDYCLDSAVAKRDETLEFCESRQIAQ